MTSRPHGRLRAVRRIGHLLRRWRTSLDRSPITDVDLGFVRGVLADGEFALWTSMTLVDRRHSVLVARRFLELVPSAVDAEIAAALLHDVGKSIAPLGTTERIFATLLEPFLRLRRWDAYYRHEEIGLELCRDVPSRERTIDLLADPHDPLAEALRRADDI